jgi:putative FmdB family regulatory protein
MPLYEYRCLNCNELFEVRQKFSDEPVAVHPECGGEGKRLLSTPQLHFKGSGFYITDYGKGGKDAIKPVSPKTESKTESKSETKTETKSETKTETKTESKPAPAPAATKSE